MSDEIRLTLASVLPHRYELSERLGAGGFALVYAAWDAQLKRHVAIKVLHPAVAQLHSDAVIRFRHEAQTLAQLNHPNVIPVFDAAESGGLLFMILPRIEGGSLEGELNAAGRLSEDEALRLMGQTGEGLKAAHDRGVVHRDVKPANILLQGPERRAVLTDFGIAKSPITASQAGLTAPDTGIGTVLYVAPEQAEDAPSADARSDIYAFGATFYHALTGQPPFVANNTLAILLKHKTEPLVTPHALNPGLQPWVSQLVERCLAKSPADRFQTVDEILAELRAGTAARPWDRTSDPELLPFLSRFQERRESYLNPERLREPHAYVFPNGRCLTILSGDITEQVVDAIVSSDDEALSMGGGVSGRIRIVGGSEIAGEAYRYVSQRSIYPLAERPAKYLLPGAGVRPGRAVVTGAGGLKARFVFHGVTLGAQDGSWIEPSRNLIAEIMESCFYHADTLRINSIAFPLLATGAGTFPRDVCLDTMFHFLARKLLRGVTSVSDVRLVIFAPVSAAR